MHITRILAPPHSLLLVMDRATGEPPEPDSVGVGAVSATPSCVAIGTLPEVDGQTRVTLSDHEQAREDASDLRQVFDGLLSTPSREVCVFTSALEVVVSLPALTTQGQVRVWTNHESLPDHVLVVVSGVGS